MRSRNPDTLCNKFQCSWQRCWVGYIPWAGKAQVSVFSLPSLSQLLLLGQTSELRLRTDCQSTSGEGNHSKNLFDSLTETGNLVERQMNSSLRSWDSQVTASWFEIREARVSVFLTVWARVGWGKRIPTLNYCFLGLSFFSRQWGIMWWTKPSRWRMGGPDTQNSSRWEVWYEDFALLSWRARKRKCSCFRFKRFLPFSLNFHELMLLHLCSVPRNNSQRIWLLIHSFTVECIRGASYDIMAEFDLAQTLISGCDMVWGPYMLNTSLLHCQFLESKIVSSRY